MEFLIMEFSFNLRLYPYFENDYAFLKNILFSRVFSSIFKIILVF